MAEAFFHGLTILGFETQKHFNNQHQPSVASDLNSINVSDGVSDYTNTNIYFCKLFQRGLLALPMGFPAVLLRMFPRRSNTSSRISKRLQKEMPSQRERQPPMALNKLPSYGRLILSNILFHTPQCCSRLHLLLFSRSTMYSTR